MPSKNFTQYKIQILLVNNIYYKSSMFKNCESLYSFSLLSNESQDNIKDEENNMDEASIVQKVKNDNNGFSSLNNDIFI